LSELDWIIFGDSPYINQIQDFSFAKNYNTIAVNRFDKCECDYRFANDQETIAEISNKNLSGKWCFLKRSVDSLIVANKLFFDNYFVIRTYLEFEGSPQFEPYKNGRLLDCRSSAMPAINFAIQRGARNIYLIGIDFNWTKGHFYNPKPTYKPLNHICELRKYVKQMAQHSNIHRVNPAPFLPLSFLPIKRIEEL